MLGMDNIVVGVRVVVLPFSSHIGAVLGSGVSGSALAVRS